MSGSKFTISVLAVLNICCLDLASSGAILTTAVGEIQQKIIMRNILDISVLGTHCYQLHVSDHK